MPYASESSDGRRAIPRAALPLLLAALFAVLLAACGGTGGSAPPEEVLINPRLSPEYSQWLVGATGRIATPEEVREFLALSSDAAAAAFVEEFWARRDPMPRRADNPLREAFDARSAEADRRFSEAGYLGRRTARGTVFVLYGEPSEVDYQTSPAPDDPPVEVWIYEPGAGAGLDGRPPERYYRFIRRGDLTELYTPRRGRVDPRPRRPGEPGYIP